MSTSKILFSLNNNFDKKFNVCHFKSVFWCIFEPGKMWNLLWPVNAIDQWNCLLYNQLHKNNNLFCSVQTRSQIQQNNIVNQFCYWTDGVLAVVGVVLSSVVDLGSLVGPNQRLWNWYLLLPSAKHPAVTITAKTGWQGIRIMCWSGETCLSIYRLLF